MAGRSTSMGERSGDGMWGALLFIVMSALAAVVSKLLSGGGGGGKEDRLEAAYEQWRREWHEAVARGDVDRINLLAADPRRLRR